EEHLRMGRSHGPAVDLRHIPFVELNTDVAFDPREGVLLANRDQHIIAGKMRVGLSGRGQAAAALRVVLGLDLLEDNAGQTAVLVGELLRHQIIENGDVLVHGILFFPGRCLHLLEARAHDNLHIRPAQPARGAAAIHSGVAASKHNHPLADLADVPEGNRGKPIDADMNIGGGLFAPENVKIAPAWRTAADENGVPVFREQCLETVDALAAAEFNAEIENVATLLVDNRLRETKTRNLGADHTAGLRVLVENNAVIAK